MDSARDPSPPTNGVDPSEEFLVPEEMSRPAPWLSWLFRLLTLLVCLAHGWAIWLGMGGWKEISGPWPLARHDHPLYYHYAVTTSDFLKQSGTTGGYDPAFMAGHPKSAVFPASSTLPEAVLFFTSLANVRPELAYKLYLLIAVALCPWLVWLAAALGRANLGTALIAVSLYLIYFWTDFPVNYAAFGMAPYLLAIPLALAATAAFCRFLSLGGFKSWLLASLLLTLVVFVHFTSAMIVVPAALCAYTAAALGERVPWGRHFGVWVMPTIVVAANVFWWLPGWQLRETKGASDFAFYHSDESVLGRLAKIALSDPPILGVLFGLGLVGAVIAARSKTRRVEAVGLIIFAIMGLFWGYLAGALQTLDFLQPGRHTYALFSAAAIAGAVAIIEALRSIRTWDLRIGLALALLLVGVRIFGEHLNYSVRARLQPAQPFLSSQPPPHLAWIASRVRDHVKPGERLLYEEGGKDLPNVPDPFQGGRYSGLLPHLVPGVELIGGPYLHAALIQNFTQFGEGKLFEEENWDRKRFERYARLYRPSAIVCWSPKARKFCLESKDLIDIIDDNGVVLIGKVKGFEGATIEGAATVEAKPGKLIVHLPAASASTKSDSVPGSVDNLVVLRYHYAPTLRATPYATVAPVRLEDDPSPFIGLKQGPTPLTLELEMDLGIRFSP